MAHINLPYNVPYLKRKRLMKYSEKFEALIELNRDYNFYTVPTTFLLLTKECSSQAEYDNYTFESAIKEAINNPNITVKNNLLLTWSNLFKYKEYISKKSQIPPTSDEEILASGMPKNQFLLYEEQLCSNYTLNPVIDFSCKIVISYTTSVRHKVLKKEYVYKLDVLIHYYTICEQDKKFNWQQNINLSKDFQDGAIVEELPEELRFTNELKNCITHGNTGISGQDFEKLVAQLLAFLNYKNITLTSVTSDYGIDIIAYNGDIKCAFQCKYYTSNIGNSAIQEAFSGKSYYDADKAYVVTNSAFTKNAQELAAKTGITLWDGSTLLKIIDDIQKL